MLRGLRKGELLMIWPSGMLVDALLPYNAMKHSSFSDVAVTVHPSMVEATLIARARTR